MAISAPLERPLPNVDAGVRAQVGTIETVEGLRGVAVLWVIVFHYCVVRSTGAADPWIAWVDGIPALALVARNGYLGVDLFFLITGFLLTLPWFRSAMGGGEAPAAGGFYERRLRRIVPAYYVQLACLFFVFLPLLRGWLYVRQDAAFLLFNLGAHATFTHYMTPITSASLSINGPLWTLALEMQYYLLLPLLAPFFVRAPLRAAAALVAVAIAWRWSSFHDMETVVRAEMAIGSWWSVPEATIRQFIASQLPGYLGHFALGILIGRAWLLARGRAASVAMKVLAAGIALASLVALHGLYAGGGARIGELAWLASLGLMAAAMAALVCVESGLASALLGNSALGFLGRVSYSAYLYHLPLLLVANHLWPQADGVSVLPAYFLSVLGVSWLSWRFVELPFMRSRASPPPRAIPRRAP
jgi:peptidoglycan/LPS O-acetylase OafA/YrhL